MPAPDVTVCVVSYNTCGLLRACLGSLSCSIGVSREVIVVDNGSSDGSPAMVREEFPGVRLIESRKNLGFAAANNLAIRQSSSPQVLLLNPDATVGASTIADMAAFLDAHPDAAICGPKVLFPDGGFQSCGYNFPTALTEIRTSRNLGTLARLLVGNERPLPSGEAPYECDWVDGCCLMVRRAAIDGIGLMDEQYFLYTEELDWCFAARKAGWKVFALPQVEMYHHRGKSSEQASDSSLALLVETKLRYFRKNHGLPTALVVSLLNGAGFVKCLWKEPRKNRAKLRGVRQFLASLR